jgi:hypothetical protein
MTQSAYRQWSSGYQAGGAYAYLRSDSVRLPGEAMEAHEHQRLAGTAG